MSKIKIEKEESDIPIPEEALWFYYNSPDKVEVTIDEITNKNMAITIKDTNELKYKFSTDYLIFRDNQVMNKNTNLSNRNFCEQSIDDETQTIKVKYNWVHEYGELEERRIQTEF